MAKPVKMDAVDLAKLLVEHGADGYATDLAALAARDLDGHVHMELVIAFDADEGRFVIASPQLPALVGVGNELRTALNGWRLLLDDVLDFGQQQRAPSRRPTTVH